MQIITYAFNCLKKSKQICTWCCYNLCEANRIAGAASKVLHSLSSTSLSVSCLEDMLHKDFSVYVDPIMAQLDTLNAQFTKFCSYSKGHKTSRKYESNHSPNEPYCNTSLTYVQKVQSD